MTPYIQFPCPHCQHRLRVKYEYLGRNLRCKYCAQEFPSPEPNDGIPGAASGQQGTEGDTQAAQQRIATLEAELGSFRNELSLQRAEDPAAAEKFEQAQGELRRLQDQIHQASVDQRIAAELNQDLLAAQSELHSVREELSSRTAQYTAAAEKFEQAQGELRRLQDQIHQAWADQRNAAELKQMLLTAQSELDELRGQVQTWQARAAEVERLQAERQADMAAGLQPPRSPAGQPSGESPTRELDGAPRSRLLEKAQSIRAQLEANSAIKERVARLAADLDAARGEKELLTSELQTAAAAAAAPLRAKVGELEHSLAELTTAHADLDQAFQQGRRQWESERQTLHRDWEEKHQSHVRGTEQRLKEEKTRLETDRGQIQEQLDAARQTHEQESTSLRGEVERLHLEAAALREERDASLNQVHVLGDEHHRMAAERDEIDGRYKEAVERFGADVARLTQAWQQSRQQEATAAEQNHALAAQVENLRAELDQQRGRETEHLQTIAALQQATETALAEAEVEAERIKSALAGEKAHGEAERQKWLGQMDAAQRRFDENERSLQSEVERLREELKALQEALEIVGVVGE